MLTLDARNFIVLLHTLLSLEQKLRNTSDVVPPEMVKTGDHVAQELLSVLVALDLEHSAKTTKNMLFGADTTSKIHRAVEQITTSVMIELDGRKFYGPTKKLAQYYEQSKLFGDDVFVKFPSANNDIFEAGMCLALERGTGCAMHLMRVAEAGLKALGLAVGTGPQNSWGDYLREIDKKLPASTASGPDRQFYAEARITLDGMRIAWRNPSMHLEQSYSPERAEEMIIAVRAFMRHLATRLSE